MTLKVIHRLQVFSSAIRRTFCAAFHTISTDSVLAWFLCISRASCFIVRDCIHKYMKLPASMSTVATTRRRKKQNFTPAMTAIGLLVGPRSPLICMFNWIRYCSVIFVNGNENENGEKRENSEFVNKN